MGRFDDHHALLARLHLDHMDHLSGVERQLDEEVDRLMGPFSEAATRLLTIPGVGKRVAEVVVAEIGVDMSLFPPPPSSPPGPASARATTNRGASAGRATPARVMPPCARRCARRPGPRRTPRRALCPPRAAPD